MCFKNSLAEKVKSTIFSIENVNKKGKKYAIKSVKKIKTTQIHYSIS